MQLDHFCSHWSIKLPMKFFAPIMRYWKDISFGRRAISIFHCEFIVLPFSAKNYPSEIFTRGLPGSSLVNKQWGSRRYGSPPHFFGAFPWTFTILTIFPYCPQQYGAVSPAFIFDFLLFCTFGVD